MKGDVSMNKRQKWELRVIKKQMVEIGYAYKRIKRLIVKVVFNATRKRKKE